MDIYAAVTDRVIAQMEQGIIPWHKPWVACGKAISRSTGKPYSLLNQMILGKAGEYVTFKQCQQEGGKVRKGEKASMVVFWKWMGVKDEETEEVKQIPFLRYFSVFHIDQCEGLTPKCTPVMPDTAFADQNADQIIDGYVQRSGVKLVNRDGDRAYYEHGDAKVKQNLQMLLETVQEGDTVITLEVSRLSRSTKQLCEIIEIIREKHLRLVIVGSITIDCRNGELDCMSAAFLQMAGVFSELELQMIRARVKSGMANAKAKGKKVGRPRTTKDDIPMVFFKHYPTYTAGKMNVSELARVCGLSRPTVYKYFSLIDECPI